MKRILIWSGLSLLGIVAIILIIGAILTARAGARLEEKIAALRAAGQPVSLADLAPAQILPQSNAFTYIVRAQSDLAAIETEVNAANESSSQEDQDAFYDARPTPAVLRVLRGAFAVHPSVMPLVQEASDCSDFNPQRNFHTDINAFIVESGDEFSACRSMIRVAGYEVLVQLDEGHSQEAMETCLAMFRLARLLERDPLLIGGLVCIAVRDDAIDHANAVLRSGPLPDAAYVALEQELALPNPVEHFRHMVRSERAYSLEVFREMRDNLGYTEGVSPGFKFAWPWIKFVSPWLKDDACAYLDGVESGIRGADLSNRQWNSEIDAKILSDPVGPLTEMLPVLQGVHDAALRDLAGIRTLRVLNALLRREQAGATGEPTLADLGLPVDVTTDPFNDEALHLKKLPGGWLVYSVGPNLKDDGGDLTEVHDVGLRPLPPPRTTAAGAETPPENAAE